MQVGYEKLRMYNAILEQSLKYYYNAWNKWKATKKKYNINMLDIKK